MDAHGPAIEFPASFLWGCATSAYQVEGSPLADGAGPSIWQRFTRTPGLVRDGDTGDIACDQYRRYAEDIALMKRLGMNAYRFSISWSRVLPEGRGRVNAKGLDHYERLVDTLLANGLSPAPTLFHWDLPAALDDLGGWLNPDIAGWFADYAAMMGRRYGDRVKRFATFNEPGVFTMFGYGFAWGAPGIADRIAFHKAIHHVNLAHGAAVDALRASVPQASIGAIHNRQQCFSATEEPADKTAAQVFEQYWNCAFPDPQHFASYPPALAGAIEPYIQPGDMSRICRPIDWFGLNHYSPNYIKADAANALGFMLGAPPPDVPRTAIGWPIVPEGFHHTLLDIHRRFRLPIYVLENGTAAEDQLDANGNVNDADRIAYLKAHTDAMRDAIAAGADVRGYFVWSLLDNFEWGSGYTQRFGIVYVDYKTQRRIPKASARWYGQLIAKSRHAELTPVPSLMSAAAARP